MDHEGLGLLVLKDFDPNCITSQDYRLMFLVSVLSLISASLWV